MKMKIDRYFARRIDDQLSEWAHRSNHKTVALISGARRTGKTYSLHHLGQTLFSKYIIIDVQELNDEMVSGLLDKDKRVDYLCDLLIANNITKEDINEKLLIAFDEIQEHNELKASISVFNRDLDCRFACTGSALWINETGMTRPTTDYEPFTVYPFSFPDFLAIIGKKELLSKERDTKLNVHKRFNPDNELSRLLRLYIAVGGMPQSILCYLDNQNNPNLYTELNRIKRISVVSTYQNDLARYSKEFGIDLSGEYGAIRSCIGRVNNISSVMNVYDKLERMNIVIVSKNLNEINKKLPSSIDNGTIKPFFLDTGILFYYLSDDSRSEVVSRIYEDFIKGKDSDDNGFLFENYVASSLKQQGIDVFFKVFSEENDGETKNYELDFVFADRSGPIVLEAKSGKEKEAKSLARALIKYHNIHSSYVLGKCYQFNGANSAKGPHTIPFYALSFLLE